MTTTDLDSTPADPALSHTRGDTTVPLLTETIADNLAATVERFGDRDALVDVSAGRRWTYTEFLADIRRLASGLHRLEVNVRPENAASLRVLSKLGLREEGRRERFLHIDGAWRDHRSFAVTADEVSQGELAARLTLP